MMSRTILFGLAAALIAAPAPALACRATYQMRSFLFDALPEVPPGAVAAKVEILSDGWNWAHPQIRARVISMLRGPYRGSELILEPKSPSSCVMPPPRGTVGFVVGRTAFNSDGILHLTPEMAPGVPAWLPGRR